MAKKVSMSADERLAAALVPEEDWPYEIPENWCWVHLGCLSSNQYGYTAKAVKNEMLPKMLRITDIQDNGVDWSNVPNCEIDEEEIAKYLLNDNDIVIARTGATTGKSYILFNPINAVFASYLIRLRIDSAALPHYVFLFLQSDCYWKQILELSSGIAQPGVNSTKLQSLLFPLPPLAEQQHIVDHIESLFAKLDEAAEEAQAVIDGYEDRKAAILHRAFTGELTEEWRVLNNYRYDQWTSRKLSECGSWIGGGTPSMSNPEYWEKGDLLWITSKDMKTNLIEDTLMHTNMLGVSNSSANYCDKPSLLFVMRSGILRRTLPISMVKKPFTVNQDIKALSPNDIDLDYLYYVCKAHEKAMLVTCMKNGTTVESINSQILMSFTVPIASKPEQHEIVRRLDTLLVAEATTKDAAEATLENITTLRQSILARAFRGALGTNDPNEEPAIELLKRTISTQ